MAQPSDSDRVLTANAMREDLVFLRDTWGPMDRSFSVEQRSQFVSIINEVIENVEALTEADFALEVARAVATSGNNHTRADPFPFLSFLPIRLWWFSDGLYVVRAHPDHEELLGAEVLRIDAMPAEQALEQLTPFLAGTAEWRRYVSRSYLISPEALYWSGISDSAESVVLTVRLQNDETRQITLGRQPAGGPPIRGLTLLTPPEMNNPERWPHVLDSVEAVPPAFSEAVDVAHDWLSADTVYIRSNMIHSADETHLHAKLIDTVHGVMADARARLVLVDLRFNTGGNLYETVTFSQMLPALLPSDGRIVVLISNVTVSAALVTAAMLRKSGGDQVLFAGETMGDRSRFWAEGMPIFLPRSGIPVVPASGLHDWSDGCRGEEHCFPAAEVYARPGTSLSPDFTLLTSFEQYSLGRDAVLEAVIELMQ